MFTVFLFVSPTDAGRPDFCSKRKKNSTQNTQLEQRLAPLSISSPLKWPKKHKNRKALHHSRKLRKDAIRMLTFKKKNNQAIVYLGPIKGSVSLQPIVQRRKITGRPWKSSTNLLPQFASGEEKLEIAQRIAPSGICFAGYREYSEKTTQRAPPQHLKQSWLLSWGISWMPLKATRKIRACHRGWAKEKNQLSVHSFS